MPQSTNENQIFNPHSHRSDSLEPVPEETLALVIHLAFRKIELGATYIASYTSSGPNLFLGIENGFLLFHAAQEEAGAFGSDPTEPRVFIEIKYFLKISFISFQT